ncbi:co-chaperone GroES [candidate division TM6 bacterium RIFCSPHIGHO2_12_FULL_32_22]|nr:MAG: co-chaperone GroES [candidate division TM6 bacterium RIFCSPHIGHO2_12_FULL_32_22]
MFEKIKPLYDRVLIKRIEINDKTPGGIIIPDAAKDKAQTGEVVAIGAGRLSPEGKAIPMQVKVGDVVYFGKYSGTEAGDDYLIIREDELLGTVQR